MTFFTLVSRFPIGLILLCVICAVSSETTEDDNNKTDDPHYGALCHEAQPQGKQTKKYFVHNNKAVTFLEAWRQCQIVGHRLATVTSDKDSTLLQKAIEKAGNQGGPWYIAGTDLGNEGNFVWISTNTPVGYGSGYSDWYPAQPDNAGGNENCIEIGRWGGVLWNDVPCDWKQHYICEYIS